MGGTHSSGDAAFGDAARIAEYEALRAESDRSAQLLSNAVWIGVTGFGLTLAGAAAASADGLEPALVPAVACLLGIQSFAITMLYLSELWKYVRVGTYIRIYIEGSFPPLDAKTYAPPMHWETWIDTNRAEGLHRTALIFLQAPIIIAAILLAFSATGALGRIEADSIEYVGYLRKDPALAWALGLLLVADAVGFFLLRDKLLKARNGDFGDGGKSVDHLRGAAAAARSSR